MNVSLVLLTWSAQLCGMWTLGQVVPATPVMHVVVVVGLVVVTIGPGSPEVSIDECSAVWAFFNQHADVMVFFVITAAHLN